MWQNIATAAGPITTFLSQTNNIFFILWIFLVTDVLSSRPAQEIRSVTQSTSDTTTDILAR